MAEASITAKLVAEFIGTFLLVFTVGCNVMLKTPVWAAVSIASVLMVMIYSLGGISGAHFNPAVTVTCALTNSMKGPGGMSWKNASLYIVCQLLGGIAASLSYALLFWNAFTLQPVLTQGLLQGIIGVAMCEIIYTFMLCFVVLNVAVATTTAGNQYYGLAIGFVIIAGAYGSAPLGAGCFNPAVAVGIDLSSAGLGFGWCIAYTIFELLGAGLAAVAFKLVRPSEFAGAAWTSDGASTLLSEFLGTFMLIFTVGLNVLGGSKAAAFSIAASLMCMIYALGDVSGAHFNPAVTAAIKASGMGPETLDGPTVGKYVASQVLGGLCAAASFLSCYPKKIGTLAVGPAKGFRWGQVAVAEIIFTFVLCYVVLCVAVSGKTKSSTMFGFAIGSCVTVGGFAIGGISGGSLNPAVSIAMAGTHIVEALAYIAFELVGAGLAAGAAAVTHAKKEIL